MSNYGVKRFDSIICCRTCLHRLDRGCRLYKQKCLRVTPAKGKVYPDWPKLYDYNTYALWERISHLPEELFDV
jgi:hypothetical protein